MTDGIIQQAFNKYRQLRFSPWDNELEQELIEKIKQELERQIIESGTYSRISLGIALEKLIGDNNE